MFIACSVFLESISVCVCVCLCVCPYLTFFISASFILLRFALRSCSPYLSLVFSSTPSVLYSFMTPSKQHWFHLTIVFSSIFFHGAVDLTSDWCELVSLCVYGVHNVQWPQPWRRTFAHSRARAQHQHGRFLTNPLAEGVLLEALNACVSGIYLHVLADALGSVGVIISSLFVWSHYVLAANHLPLAAGAFLRLVCGRPNLFHSYIILNHPQRLSAAQGDCIGPAAGTSTST